MLTYVELQCSYSTLNSSLPFRFHSLHEIKNMDSPEGLEELQYLTSHRYALHHMVREKFSALYFSNEQPVRGSFYVHDFMLLPSQLFSPFHPLPSAPELKIFHFCLFQWLIFRDHHLNSKVKASSCNLSPLLPVLVSEKFLERPRTNRDAKETASTYFLTHAFVYICKVFMGLRILLGHRE